MSRSFRYFVFAESQTGLGRLLPNRHWTGYARGRETSRHGQAASMFVFFFRGRPGFWGPQSSGMLVGSGRRSVTLPHCKHWTYLPQRSSIRCMSPLHRGQALKWTIDLHPRAGVRSSRDDPSVTEWHHILVSEGPPVKLNMLECIKRVAFQIFD